MYQHPRRNIFEEQLDPVFIGANCPAGTCTTDSECYAHLEDACKGAGYGGGVKRDLQGESPIIRFPDGSAICAGFCAGISKRGTTGAAPFGLCGAPKKPKPKPQPDEDPPPTQD